MGSVVKKRRKKIAKHKYKKLRKRMRAEKRRYGKI
ncbi:TPA: AURKAIP1/COX24 domain-containing protein [bacterium]|nr:AURKAIP1/COX24 domain-containing protein [bacterium]